MKFNIAWANVVKENVSLKIALLIVGVTAIFLGAGLFVVSTKEPFVIERACGTRVLEKSINTEPSVSEIKAFAKEALTQRFNSGLEPKEAFLSPIEIKAKVSEETLLKKKNINQASVIRNVFVVKNKTYADIDRVFAMGDSRPAYASKLALDIQFTSRSEDNPYGLILNRISFLDQKGDKSGK